LAVDPSGLLTFLYKTGVQIDGALVNFHYLKCLEWYVLLVEYTGADGSVYKAIAKFTKDYGREVHECIVQRMGLLLSYWPIHLLEHYIFQKVIFD